MTSKKILTLKLAIYWTKHLHFEMLDIPSKLRSQKGYKQKTFSEASNIPLYCQPGSKSCVIKFQFSII